MRVVPVTEGDLADANREYESVELKYRRALVRLDFRQKLDLRCIQVGIIFARKKTKSGLWFA